MNIFASDTSPIKSAIALDNKRVVKMILESAQMLSTAVFTYTGKSTYKPAFSNHPCTIWVRSSRENYVWLLEHFKALCDEYTYRYDKQHKCEALICEFENGIEHIPSSSLTEFADCTGENVSKYLSQNKDNSISNINITDKYKLCLALKWQNDKLFPRWYKRQKPEWYNDYDKQVQK